VPLERLSVGSVRNVINPETGAPEFAFDGLTQGMGDFANRIANTQINIDPTYGNNQMSDEGRRLLIQRETIGGKPTPHTDVAGNFTSGYGHKGTLDASPEEVFNRDVATADSVVNRNTRIPLTQAEHDALGSLAYNIGARNFANSTIPSLIRSGDFEGAAKKFLEYNKITKNGKLEFNQGLANRRQGERDQFIADTLFVRAPRLP
jgi:lysozyme